MSVQEKKIHTAHQQPAGSPTGHSNHTEREEHIRRDTLIKRDEHGVIDILYYQKRARKLRSSFWFTLIGINYRKNN